MASLTKPTVKINNVTYEDVPSVQIQGITDSTGTYDALDFYWTGDASVVEGTGADVGTTAQVLTGVTVYGPNGKLTGNMVAQTGDFTTDSISATSSIVKLSVPSTNYYSTNANITATFKGSGSILAAWDTQNSTAYNTDGSNLTVTAKTGFIIPNGYYQGKTASVTTGTVTASAAYSSGDATYFSSDETDYVLTVTPTANVSTAGWIDNGSTSGTPVTKYLKEGSVSLNVSRSDGTSTYLSDTSTAYSFRIVTVARGDDAGWISSGSLAGSSDSYYLKVGSASAGATIGDASSALTGSSTDGTPTVTVTPTRTVSSNGWMTESEITTNAAQTKYIKKGSATPSMSWAASSDDYFLSSGTNNYSIQVTPTATVGTAGWISSISDGTPVTKYLKPGSALAGATLTDDDSILTGVPTDNTPFVTVTPTRTVTTSGWMTESEITADIGFTRYVKPGSVTLSAARTGGTAQIDSNGTYTVEISASGTTTAGWVSSNPTTATATVKIKDAGISNFDMLSGSDSANTSTTDLTVTIGHMVGPNPTDYVGYIDGGSATIRYSTLANAHIASIGSTHGKTMLQVSSHILADTTILGVTGTIATKTASDVTYTANTSTAVTIPAGYYAEQVTKNVPTVTPATPGSGGSGGSGILTIE